MKNCQYQPKLSKYEQNKNIYITCENNTSESSNEWLEGSLASHTGIGVIEQGKYLPNKSHGHITLC